jgi:hypothetical protein
MRFLGFLFLMALLLACVGYFRGWFSVTTTHAGGKNDITLGVDGDRIGDDAKVVTERLGVLSEKAVEAVRSLGRKVGTDESELEGVLSAVSPTRSDITLTVGTQAIELHVPPGTSIKRDSEVVGLDQLQVGARVKVTVKQTGEERRLSRIEVLH